MMLGARLGIIRVKPARIQVIITKFEFTLNRIRNLVITYVTTFMPMSMLSPPTKRTLQFF